MRQKRTAPVRSDQPITPQSLARWARRYQFDMTPETAKIWASNYEKDLVKEPFLPHFSAAVLYAAWEAAK
jgi:hypothetical protein